MTPGGGQPHGADGAPSPPAPCELCDGTGWLQIEDPFLGGYLDAACPDCEGAGHAH